MIRLLLNLFIINIVRRALCSFMALKRKILLRLLHIGKKQKLKKLEELSYFFIALDSILELLLIWLTDYLKMVIHALDLTKEVTANLKVKKDIWTIINWFCWILQILSARLWNFTQVLLFSFLGKELDL